MHAHGKQRVLGIAGPVVPGRPLDDLCLSVLTRTNRCHETGKELKEGEESDVETSGSGQRAPARRALERISIGVGVLRRRNPPTASVPMQVLRV